MNYRPEDGYEQDQKDYCRWVGIGDVAFTDGWVEIERNGTISEDQVPAGKEMHTIAFNLSVLKEANKYYFDDISLKVLKQEEQTYDDFTNLITNGKMESFRMHDVLSF